MNIIDNIRLRISQRKSVLVDNNAQFISWGKIECRPFAELVWLNICDLLCDLVERVRIAEPLTFTDSDKRFTFSAFRAFVYTWGRVVWQMLFDCGFCPIGWDGSRFFILGPNQYTTCSDGFGRTIVVANNPELQVYVMRSPTYISQNKSDKEVCRAWLMFLDDVCNSSATINRRLGTCVVASPKNVSGATMPVVLTDDQKEKLEKRMREDYGSLSHQSNIMLLPREMKFETINLAGLDNRLLERVRLCVCAICDRFQLPANQSAIIEANASKALSNGSELREGDRLKYASAKRLFEATFVQMANEMAIPFEYIFEGEPKIEENKTTTETI